MRRGLIGFCCLVALGAVNAFAAEETGKPDIGPSLEYRPPKPILPEPKGPTPAPPMTVFRESFGNFGIGRGSFDKPIDVAFGADNRVYVLDALNNRVQLFDKSNNFILEWGEYGTDESRCQFKNPTAIAVIPDVRVPCANSTGTCEVVLVVDTGNNRFQWFKVPVTRDSREKLPNFPCGDPKSVFNAYLRPSDTGEGNFGDWGEYGISDSAKFNRPLDVVFEGRFVGRQVRGGPRDELMFRVLDAGNERIQRFRLGFDCANRLCFPAGNNFDETINNLTADRGNLKGMVSLTWSSERSFDFLYVLGTGCAIQKFKFTANTARPVLDDTWPAVAPESGLCVPTRVRYDSKKEYLYVLDSGNSMISIFHRSGNFISAIRGADRAFDEPGGFDFLPESGEFVVADTGNDLVQKFTLR